MTINPNRMPVVVGAALWRLFERLINDMVHSTLNRGERGDADWGDCVFAGEGETG